MQRATTARGTPLCARRIWPGGLHTAPPARRWRGETSNILAMSLAATPLSRRLLPWAASASSTLRGRPARLASRSGRSKSNALLRWSDLDVLELRPREEGD
jgi:hypothetical protein